MNLLGAKLYDPAGAVSKVTTSLLAMTALDTTNLRVTVTVPAHGMLLFRLRCTHHGATTNGQHLLGVLNGSTVVGRVSSLPQLLGTAIATTQILLRAEFVKTGLTPGSTNFDAAYGVEIVSSASGAIKYGGPNDTTTNNAFGAFCFEVWDPAPLQVSSAALQIDSNGRIDIGEVLGTAIATPATAGVIDVNVKNMNNVTASAITTIKAVQGLAVDGVITTLTNLPAITANWLTAAGINAAALNGKGDWNIGKTGYALSAAAIQAIWDALTSALTTVGSIGKLLVDNINAAISSRLATAGYTAPLDAAGTRTALGLATANLDTQLDALPTAAENGTAVLSAATSAPIASDIKKVNNTTLQGDGSITPWGPV